MLEVLNGRMGGRFELGYSMDIRTKDGKAIRGIRLTHEAVFVNFEVTSPNDRPTRIFTCINLGLHLFVILYKYIFLCCVFYTYVVL